MESVRAKDKRLQCSAEGHVSHIYSDRMSSRPLGWSRTGADKMARLRIYRQNKRNILELVRYQKKELPLAAGAEEVIFSNADAGCRKAQQKQAWKTGRYAGIQYSLSTDKKDSGTKKSYMGIVRKEEIGYSKNSYQI